MSERADRVRRLEQEEFERGHIAPDEEPAEPRPAATLVVARDGGGEMEVLLLQRPEETRFAAGAWVFPGGTVDEEDGRPAVARRVDGERADGEPAALAAAARELFEETGLLLSDPPLDAGTLRRARRELLAGEASLGGMLSRRGLRLPDRPVAYFSRWITPERLARRYDARFFLARHPGGEASVGDEHTAALWISPRSALEERSAGRLPMLFPTRKSLELLAGFPDPGAAIRSLRARPVSPVLPRLVEEEGRVVPVLPGDPRYDGA